MVVVINEDILRKRLHPIIKALIVMITDSELGEFLDNQGMEDSAIEQIVQALKETIKVERE